MPSPLIIRNLSKSYGSLKAVDDVSFEMREGEIFGLLGPNGAGKTTVISSIVTLEKPSSGEVIVHGHNVLQDSRLSKSVTGFVPQELVVHGYFDVEEILRFHSGFYGLLRNQERIDFLLRRLGLWEHKNKKVRQLSGGMKRRLLIAKALVHEPKLLLLDEPTAGVDSELRQTLWAFVRELRASGLSILLTTHYLEEAEQMCDRVGILHRGKLVKIGETRELIREMTQREVVFTFASGAPSLKHQYLHSQKEGECVFRIPYSMSLGELLAELRIDVSQLKDVQIREGSLEDAFMRVVGGDP